MTIYYVDQTTGDDADTGLTEALAWKTIAKVNGATFAGDDQILFKCGEVWRETLIPHNAGTSGHQITYGSYGTGAKPLISGADAGAPTTPVRDYCVYDSEGRGYITIDGLAITYAKLFGIKHNYWVLGEEGSTPNWIVQNCALTYCGMILFGPNTIIQDNTVVGPSALADGVNEGGIFIRGEVSANCSVLRNTIHDYGARGIWCMDGVDSPTVNDNIVYNISFIRGTTEEGFGIDFDGYAVPITGFVTCLRNTVYDCDRWGIFFENCSGGSDVSRNLIHGCPNAAIEIQNTGAESGDNIGAKISYNVTYDNGNGISIYNASGVDIWNNVFDATIPGWFVGVQLVGTPAYVVDIDIRNNIFGSGFTVVLEVPGDDWTDNISAFDYNCVEDLVALIYEDTGEEAFSLAQLQAAGKALHCFSTDPGFVDAAGHDYHLLATSPCINAGVDVGLTEDFEGNPIV